MFCLTQYPIEIFFAVKKSVLALPCSEWEKIWFPLVANFVNIYINIYIPPTPNTLSHCNFYRPIPSDLISILLSLSTFDVLSLTACMGACFLFLSLNPT